MGVCVGMWLVLVSATMSVKVLMGRRDRAYGSTDDVVVVDGAEACVDGSFDVVAGFEYVAGFHVGAGLDVGAGIGLGAGLDLGVGLDLDIDLHSAANIGLARDRVVSTAVILVGLMHQCGDIGRRGGVLELGDRTVRREMQHQADMKPCSIRRSQTPA